MSEYSREPWPPYIDVAVVMTPNPEGPTAACISFEDYQRARACVNACAGIDTEQIERMAGSAYLQTPMALVRDLNAANIQRGELLTALKSAKDALRSYQFGNSATALAESIANSCDATIAKAEGK